MKYLILILGLLSTGLSDAQDSLRLWVYPFPAQTAEDAPILVDSIALVPAAPVFSPDNLTLYYLSQVGKGYSVVGYNMQSASAKVIHNSGSPLTSLRITPDGKFLSWIMKSEKEPSLVRMPVTGGSVSSIVNMDLEDHVWIDDNNLLIISTGKPNTLTLLSLRPMKTIPVAQHVGKTLAHSQKIPSFAFVHKLSVDTWSIKTIRPDGSIAVVANTLPDSDIIGLQSDGTPLHAFEGNVYHYDTSRKEWRMLPVNTRWSRILHLQTNAIGNRIAILSN